MSSRREQEENPVTDPEESGSSGPEGTEPTSTLESTLESAWLSVYQAAQAQTAEAHAAWQAAMAEAHLAFLRTAEAAMVGLTAMLAGQPLLAPQLAVASPGPVRPAPSAPARLPFSSPGAGAVGRHARSRSVEPALATPVAPPPRAVAATVAARPAPPPAPAARVAAPPAVAAAAAAPAARDAASLEALLLEVVAEKTGYPASMLEMQMSLEADLGIDSIKRVEILAALRSRVPDLPEVPASELARLATLGQIVDFLRAGTAA